MGMAENEPSLVKCEVSTGRLFAASSKPSSPSSLRCSIATASSQVVRDFMRVVWMLGSLEFAFVVVCSLFRLLDACRGARRLIDHHKHDHSSSTSSCTTHQRSSNRALAEHWIVHSTRQQPWCATHGCCRCRLCCWCWCSSSVVCKPCSTCPASHRRTSRVGMRCVVLL